MANIADIDALLVPISAEAPGGADLSFSTEFDSIQEARRHEDPSLAQGEWVRDIKEADWAAVIERCADILRERSKDLRVAGWLTEALAKKEGFAGLAAGLGLTEQLVNRFWPHLYPQIDGDDREERVGSLVWLVQRTTALVREIPLSQAASGSFAWIDHESARALQNQVDRKPDEAEALLAGRTTLAMFKAACQDTPKAFYEALYADFDRMRNMSKQLESSIDAHLGSDGPGFSPLREALDNVGTLVERLARDAGVLKSAKPEHESDADAAGADDSAPEAAFTGPIRTRAQALRQLRQVAEFFRHTEPHSPVAYLADKAASWGEIPLHQWLKQVIKDGGALAHLEELLGMESAKDADSQSR